MREGKKRREPMQGGMVCYFFDIQMKDLEMGLKRVDCGRGKKYATFGHESSIPIELFYC
jgi:hypothetical protein